MVTPRWRDLFIFSEVFSSSTNDGGLEAKVSEGHPSPLKKPYLITEIPIISSMAKSTACPPQVAKLGSLIC